MSTKGHTGDAGQEEAFVTGSFQDSRVPLLKAVGYLFKQFHILNSFILIQ